MTDRPSSSMVYVDTNAFIRALEGSPDVAAPVLDLFAALRRQPGVGVTSELTLAEVLVGPEKRGLPPLRRSYIDVIVSSGIFSLEQVSRDVLLDSVRLRVAHERAYGKKLKLPDTIHLVTAIRARCRYFLSIDAGIRTPVEMIKVAPDSAGTTEVLKALA